MKGESYDLISAFKVDGVVYNVKGIKASHIRKIARNLQLGPQTNAYRKITCTLAIGSLKSRLEKNDGTTNVRHGPSIT